MADGLCSRLLYHNGPDARVRIVKWPLSLHEKTQPISHDRPRWVESTHPTPLKKRVILTLLNAPHCLPPPQKIPAS